MNDRTFLRELEQYTDCPELVGRCFLQRVRGTCAAAAAAAVKQLFRSFDFDCFPADERPADL